MSDDAELSGDVAGVGMVNINTASLSELDELWGVGESRAKTIIEKRPYGSLEELKSKAGIPESVLEENRRMISVYVYIGLPDLVLYCVYEVGGAV